MASHRDRLRHHEELQVAPRFRRVPAEGPAVAAQCAEFLRKGRRAPGDALLPAVSLMLTGQSSCLLSDVIHGRADSAAVRVLSQAAHAGTWVQIAG